MAKKQNAKIIETVKEIASILESKQLPEEIIQEALERLDRLIATTHDMKARVDKLNTELHKMAYFN